MSQYRTRRGKLVVAQPLVKQPPLVRVPPWMVLAGLVLRGLWTALRFCARRPVRTAAALGGLWLYATYGGHALAVASACAVAVAAVLLVAIRWLRPGAYLRYVVLPLLGRWRRWWVYGRRWPDALRMCELHKHTDGDTLVPRLRRVVCTPSTDRLVVRMLMGQSPEHFRRRSAELAYTFGARHAQVFERRPDTRPSRTGRLAWLLRRIDSARWADRAKDVHVVIVRRDCLVAIVPPFPSADSVAQVDFTSLPLAWSFLGEVFRFRLLATHVLVAGASRRGKGSVIWALIAALGPAVRSGLCRLWVIDPKGGMELAMGAPMFTRFAYRSAEEIAAALDDAVRVMRARQARLSGKVRVHTPTVSDPLTVVIVDELGALTKYIADVELRRRIEAALGLLLSQGAGLGILVVGALQDPRKENLDLRDLFLSRILLGVTADTHVDMVLGDGMRARGALADQLDASAKGVGYVLPDGMHDPVRVRFPFHDDAAIRALAQEYPAPPDTTAADAVVLTMPSHAKQGARRAATVAGSLIPAALIGALDPNGQGEPR